MRVHQLEFEHSEEIKLTARESECLFYLLRGKTAKKIATILGISHRTVETYVDYLKIKFQALNKSELIEKAIEKGYFNICIKKTA